MSFLREIGRHGCEGLALWVGDINEEDAVVQSCVIPKQHPVKSEYGLSVHVDGETLHELNVWLHQERLRLLAQVHSHGEFAYHSETDDEHSIVTTFGALSIVVPHFATASFSFKSAAVLRLTSDGWQQISEKESERLVTVR